MGRESAVEQHDDEDLREMYRLLRLCRTFEEARESLVDAGEVPGHCHLSVGQEAVAVGTCLPLRDDDVIGSTHRCTAHVIAKGADPNVVMAEFGAKQTGMCAGRGGEMHMFDPALGVETSGIVGGTAPHVAGAVTAAQIDDRDRVGVSFFGDGGINQGVVPETMNLAAVWDLPMVFLCENNKYGAATPRDYAVAGERIADRAVGYGMPTQTVDGQDVFAVHDAVTEAIDAARDGRGPSFIECDTYRYTGHYSKEEAMLGDDRAYRSDAEIEDWRQNRDPIDTFRATVVGGAGRLTEADLEAIDDAVDRTVDEAVAFMRESDHAPAENALAETYADQSYATLPDRRYG